jgi:hypothetical protein
MDMILSDADQTVLFLLRYDEETIVGHERPPGHATVISTPYRETQDDAIDKVCFLIEHVNLLVIPVGLHDGGEHP